MTTWAQLAAARREHRAGCHDTAHPTGPGQPRVWPGDARRCVHGRLQLAERRRRRWRDRHEWVTPLRWHDVSWWRTPARWAAAVADLADQDTMSGFLRRELRNGLADEEDAVLLWGDGTTPPGSQLRGLLDEPGPS